MYQYNKYTDTDVGILCWRIFHFCNGSSGWRFDGDDDDGHFNFAVRFLPSINSPTYSYKCRESSAAKMTLKVRRHGELLWSVNSTRSIASVEAKPKKTLLSFLDQVDSSHVQLGPIFKKQVWATLTQWALASFVFRAGWRLPYSYNKDRLGAWKNPTYIFLKLAVS